MATRDFTPRVSYSKVTDPAQRERYTREIVEARRADLLDFLKIGEWFGFTTVTEANPTVRDGTAYGTAASGIRAADGALGAQGAWIVVDAAGSNRFPAREYQCSVKPSKLPHE